MRVLSALLPLLLSFQTAAPAGAPRVPSTTHVLKNGLRVVLHEDHSDPVVSVWVYYHVGSGREQPGRTGFAHLFEHMMFQGSQNVAEEEHFRLIQEAGGTLNGTTNADRTVYFETLPVNRLDLALWLEADRMGRLAPAMTVEKLEGQRDVVREERRQNYENRPYALAHELVLRHLYPEGHPYHHPTIGSMEDLGAATLEDVLAFHRRWYGPNNATLVIAGDIDPEQTLARVERYFGPLPAGPAVRAPAPWPVTLPGDVRLAMEDRAPVPELRLVWPTVEWRHQDRPALDLLAATLAGDRSALLERVLTVEEGLASLVRASSHCGEVAGTFEIRLRPVEGVPLDRLEARALEVLETAARDGFDAEHVARVRTAHEAEALRELELVSGRAARLGFYDLFAGRADALDEDLDRYAAVTPQDLLHALRAYLAATPRLVLSIVPEGRLDLAAKGCRPSEPVRGRKVPPAPPRPVAEGPLEFHAPRSWRAQLESGLEVLGIESHEVPLVRARLLLSREGASRGEHGLAALAADLVLEGAGERDGPALAAALAELGAELSVRADEHEIVLELDTPSRTLGDAWRILTEVVRSPRLTEADFERVRAEHLSRLAARAEEPRRIANDVWRAVLFGPDSPRGTPLVGTPEELGALDVAAVREFWTRVARPDRAALLVAGDADESRGRELAARLADGWQPGPAEPPPEAPPPAPLAGRLFIVDVPGAKQSEIRAGHLGPATSDPDFYPAFVVNHVLGGSFTSRLNLNLREEKGFTYGARSTLAGGPLPSPFTASTAVRTEVTAPAVREVLGELARIVAGPTGQELEFSRNALLSAQAHQYESMRAKLSLLENVWRYGWPPDYPELRAEQIRALTTEDLAAVAARLVRPNQVRVLVVGDAQRVREDLAGLDLGAPIELDRRGRPVEPAGN